MLESSCIVCAKDGYIQGQARQPRKEEGSPQNTTQWRSALLALLKLELLVLGVERILHPDPSHHCSHKMGSTGSPSGDMVLLPRLKHRLFQDP